MMATLRKFVDQRGLDPPAPGKTSKRRPRTVVMSMEKPLHLEEVHRVLHLKDGKVTDADPEELEEMKVYKNISKDVMMQGFM